MVRVEDGIKVPRLRADLTGVVEADLVLVVVDSQDVGQGLRSLDLAQRAVLRRHLHLRPKRAELQQDWPREAGERAEWALLQPAGREAGWEKLAIDGPPTKRPGPMLQGVLPREVSRGLLS